MLADMLFALLSSKVSDIGHAGFLELDSLGRQAEAQHWRRLSKHSCCEAPQDPRLKSSEALGDIRQDLNHLSKTQRQQEAAVAPSTEASSMQSVPHRLASHCNCTPCLAAHYKEALSCCSSSESSGMQKKSQQRRAEFTRSHVCQHVTKDGLQSIKAKQIQRTEALKAACRRTTQHKLEIGGSMKLKEALAIVAAARVGLPISELKSGNGRLTNGLAERRKELRLAAQYLQNGTGSKLWQAFRPPPGGGVKASRRTSSSDGSI